MYQELNNIYGDCPKSRNAICCILATIRFPRSPRGSIPQAAWPTTKRNNHGFGIGRGNLSTRKKNLGGPLPEPVRLFSNQSRGDPCYHKPEIWQVARSCHPIPQSWDAPLGGVPYLWRVSSSGGGLFKRPVILWIRGAFYLCRFPRELQVSTSGRLRLRTCACKQRTTFLGRLRTLALLQFFPTTGCGRRRPE